MIITRIKIKEVLRAKRGFTLIELLVVIAIIGILAYVAMANYVGEIKRNKVRISGETVYGELQGLKVRVADGNYFNDGTNDVFYCWGLELTTGSIETIYASYIPDSGCDYNNFSVYSGGNGVLLSDQVDVSLGGDEGDKFFVFFDPPYGDMKIFKQVSTGAYEDLETLDISLSGENVDSTRVVILNSLTGSMSLENQ